MPPTIGFSVARIPKIDEEVTYLYRTDHEGGTWIPALRTTIIDDSMKHHAGYLKSPLSIELRQTLRHTDHLTWHKVALQMVRTKLLSLDLGRLEALPEVGDFKTGPECEIRNLNPDAKSYLAVLTLMDRDFPKRFHFRELLQKLGIKYRHDSEVSRLIRKATARQ